MEFDFPDYVITRFPIKSTNSTLFKLYHPKEQFIFKLGFNIDEELIDTFSLETVASLIVKKLELDFISSIEDVVKVTTHELLEYFDFKVPEKDYYGILIKPIQNYKNLHHIIQDLKQKDIYFFDSQYAEAFWVFILKLIKLGYDYGFVHNDLHTSNILYDLDKCQFVLIDLGRAYFSNCNILNEEELSLIYNHLHGDEDIHVSTLKEYYKLVIDETSEYTKTLNPDSKEDTLMIMFDVVGLLYYMDYFEIPNVIRDDFKQLKECKIDLEKFCVLWFYAYILCIQKYYNDTLAFSDKIMEGWYLQLPLNKYRNIHDKFIHLFTKKLNYKDYSYIFCI